MFTYGLYSNRQMPFALPLGNGTVPAFIPIAGRWPRAHLLFCGGVFCSEKQPVFLALLRQGHQTIASLPVGAEPSRPAAGGSGFSGKFPRPFCLGHCQGEKSDTKSPLPPALGEADGDAGDDDGLAVEEMSLGGRFAQPGDALPPQVVDQLEQVAALDAHVADAVAGEAHEDRPCPPRVWMVRPDVRWTRSP